MTPALQKKCEDAEEIVDFKIRCLRFAICNSDSSLAETEKYNYEQRRWEQVLSTLRELRGECERLEILRLLLIWDHNLWVLDEDEQKKVDEHNRVHGLHD